MTTNQIMKTSKMKTGHQNMRDEMREKADHIEATYGKSEKYKKGGMAKKPAASCKKYAAGGAAKIRLNQYYTTSKKGNR